ncbi:SPW repeat domain-containing protein [Microvirga splendida]|uniref:SPW repeat protein n=1 Tax=Microvirga splendida TaxID=2795727 RepID=A0ABS0Y5S4_9HYPH|nr:SPW repeat protein [Microvirga splendida]MBJ6127643.1 SPW repeat protein [Microvirga splendida]
MRFLSTRIHGVIDYLWGVALIASPWLFGFGDVPAATWVAIVFGAGAMLYSAVTAYELGLLKILPMPMHLILDGLGGIVLAASPFLFGFADRVLWPHVLFGLFSVAACLVTHREPMLATGRREPA